VERTPQSQEFQYRLRFLQTLSLFVPAMGVLAALGYVVIFLITNTWQMFAAAGLALAASALFLLTRPLLSRGRSWTAALLMIVLAAVTIALYGAIWSGMTLLLIVGVWVIPGFIAWFGIERDFRLVFAPLASICGSVALLVFDRIQPFNRLTITDISILQWLIPLIATLGGALLFLVVIRGIVSGRLANRLLPSFLLIVLIPIFTLSATSILNSQYSDQRYAVYGLDTILTQKESAITAWVDALKQDLNQTDQITLNEMGNLVVVPPATITQTDRDTVLPALGQLMTKSGKFQELFLVNNDGTILVSTQPQDIGQKLPTQLFRQQGSAQLAAATLAYYQPANEVDVFVTHLILNQYNGSTVGALAGRCNLQYLQQLLPVPSTTNARLYLVNNDYSLLNDLTSGPAKTHVYTAGVTQAITTGKNGFVLYDHLNIPEVGVYHWIPALNIVLLAEIPQAIAFSTLQTTITTNLIIDLISAAVAVLGALYTLQTLNIPLTKLASAASQVAAGDLSTRADVEQEDEIGTVAKAFNTMTAEVQNLVTNLEERVNERTKALEARSRDLQTVAQIARDATLEQNSEDLLDRVAQLIRERFGYYHVGIFLIDESREYAVLRAAGGEAGKLMLANQHKLKVGQVGIVGFVAQRGEPRIALDVGADAVHFRNPLLPYTRSEMALPIKTSERIIGVLDVQSDKVNAFDQDNISIMQILTDQLGVSIERTRLLQELKQSAAAMERSFQEYSGRAWRTYLQQTRTVPGYRATAGGVEPISQASAESFAALSQGTTQVLHGDGENAADTLVVPIRVHGQTIGTLGLRYQGKEIPVETIRLVEEAANRLALALENARLVQDMRRLAMRERQINLISAQVSQSVDLETVLQNTIRELGNTLQVPKAFIQIGLLSQEEKGRDKK